jgi:hypothetical protein
MRACRREGDPERIDERAELRAAFTDALHAIGERVAAARAHFDLGRDQLTDEVRLELGSHGRLLHVLEATE